MVQMICAAENKALKGFRRHFGEFAQQNIRYTGLRGAEE